jgi:hypothetical protein
VPRKHDGHWAVFNSGGACIIENVTFDLAAEYMTPDRFSRGWNMVAIITTQAQFDAEVAQDRAARAQAEPEGWRDALKFYADRCHFALAEEDAWDTVSGEPANFWCDEAGTATVEDGTVAAMALAGTPLRDEEEDAARAQGAGEAVAHTLLREAVETIDTLPGYPKGADLCDRIEAFLTIPQAEPVAWMAFEVIGRRPILEAFSTQDRAEAFAETIKAPTEIHAVYLAPTPTASAPKAEGEAADWSVERHGSGWAIYRGRDQHHHGWNLGQLTECDDKLPALIQRALNAQPPSEADRTREGGDSEGASHG